MHSPVEQTVVERRAVQAWAAQLGLIAVTILASRVMAGGWTGTTLVFLVAGANGLVVALAAKGVRRDGQWPSVLAVLTLVLIVGLLIWPAWDISQRVRWF